MKNNNIKLSLDHKRHRIRISTGVIIGLEHPKYLEFLINPDSEFIAILGFETDLGIKSANKFTIKYNNNNCIYEICGKYFLDAVLNLYGDLSLECNYYLLGEIDKENRIAYFPLSSIKPIIRKKII